MATNNFSAAPGVYNWNVASNWSLGRVPGATDDVTVAVSSGGFLGLTILATDPAYTIASLNESTVAGSPEILSVGGSLTVTGSTVINSGSLSVVNNGNVALNTVTLSNSAQINSGNSGGRATLTIGTLSAGAGTIGGSVALPQGTVTIQSLSGAVIINVQSGTTTVANTAGTSLFNLNGGRLNLLSANISLGDTVNAGNNTSTIDLRNISYRSGETFSTRLVSTGTTNFYEVTLNSALGELLYTFQKVGGVSSPNGQTAPTISLAADDAGGTLVTLACYAGGTAIAVPGGESPVETLAIGDHVLTACGTTRRLKWIGRRAYAGRFLQANRRALPIRFRAGSLGQGVPRRDLLVSPEHAMFLEGVLIPARCLVNGASVVQDTACGRIEYFHLELDSHDVILAEGAASETFVDDNSRLIFQNASEFAALYGDAGAVPAVYCAPRVDHGPALDRARRSIDGRAGLGHPEQAGSLRGNVDGWTAGMLHGWAQATEQPEAPVCLEVLVDGIVVAHTVADLFRPDLLAAGMGSGCHGFRVRLPRSAGQAMVEVRRALDGAALGHLDLADAA